MKLGPVTKLDKRITKTSKKYGDDVMSVNCDVIVIFGFLANLDQFGSRIPDARSVILKGKILKVTLTVTFYLTKTENRGKKSLTVL